MRSKRVFFAILLAVLVALSLIPTVVLQRTLTTAFIKPDGSVSPSDLPIERHGEVYTFTGNVYDPILVQRSNVTIDGAGYSLIGPLTEAEKIGQPILGNGPNSTFGASPYIIGLDCDKTVYGLTIKNLNINRFNVGVYIRTTNNTLERNSVSDNTIGILLSGSDNKIRMNYIANDEDGLFFGFQQVNGSAYNIPTDIEVTDNSFINNTFQLSGCVCKVYNFSEAKHNWDNGKIGNFWSNYNGTDADNDGIGDTYYTIDVLNQDRYPLIQSPAQPPMPVPKISTEEIVAVAAVIVVVAVVVAAVVLLYWRYRKKTQS